MTKTTWGSDSEPIDDTASFARSVRDGIAEEDRMVAYLNQQLAVLGEVAEGFLNEERVALRRQQMGFDVYFNGKPATGFHDFALGYDICRKCGNFSRDLIGSVVCTPVHVWGTLVHAEPTEAQRGEVRRDYEGYEAFKKVAAERAASEGREPPPPAQLHHGAMPATIWRQLLDVGQAANFPGNLLLEAVVREQEPLPPALLFTDPAIDQKALALKLYNARDSWPEETDCD